MLEAVNSVLQTAPFVRSSAEQVSTADSFAANPERVQRAPLAPYVSPYVFVDVNFDTAVLQLRNGETGDVEGQFPSQATLEAQARQAARQAVARQQASRQASQPQQSQQAPEVQQQQQQAVSAQQQNQAITAQQQAAFQAAAQTGNSNAGNVTLTA